MIETAKFNFKTKTGSTPSKGKLDQKTVVGLAVLVVGVAIYAYIRYLNNVAHHRTMTAASRAVVAAMTTGSASTAATASVKQPVTVAVAVDVKPEVQPVTPAQSVAPLLAVNPSNAVPAIGAAPASASFSDSLMAVISPSAHAETVQAPLQPAPAPAPAPTASAWQTFKSQGVAHAATRLIAPPVEVPAVPLTDEQKRLEIAQTRLESVIEMAVKNPDVFGFNSDERPDQATLGDPIPVYSISPSGQKTYQPGQPIKPLLQMANEWIFPVVLNGRTRYVLPVTRAGDEYFAKTGSRALAMVLEKIYHRWPASEGYHPQLVVNPNMTNYYFTIPELSEQNLTDIGDMFQYKASLSPASVILASW